MDIQIKSIGELIDSLMTTSQSCWHAQDKILDETLSDKERLNAAVKAQQTNIKRVALIRAINERLEEANFLLDTKSYDKSK